MVSKHQSRRMVSIDPGGTSGWCQYEPSIKDPRSRFITDQLPPTHHRELWRKLSMTAPGLVVCESFTYRSHMDKAELVSVEYIGIIKLWAEMTSTPVHLQPASMGKATGKSAFWNVTKLKLLGLYQPARTHAMDAMSHMLYYVTFTLGDQTYLEMLPQPSQ